MISESEILSALEDVKDPEIPKLSIVDMGIVTGIKVTDDNNVHVKITPTFAGCPALNVMKNDIKDRILKMDVKNVEVEVNYDVQWNSNMISERGRKMLSESNFALPAHHDGFVSVEMLINIECPFCGSKNTKLQTPFGPTQCRAIHYCNNCLQAFEQFKPV